MRLLAVTLLLLSGTAAAGEPASLVTAARVHSMQPGAEPANAFVHAGGEILAVGSREQLIARYPKARERAFPGRTIVPGFIDAHGHLMGLGLSLLRVDLVGTRSREEILERLQSFAATLPEDAWLLGRGWDQNDWPRAAFPTRADLDGIFRERPVWLERIDGHAAWGNSAALAAADRDFSGDWQPEGGRIVRDESGRPTGIFVDRAMEFIDGAIPPPSPELLERALAAALDKAASVGLTGMHDAGVSAGQLDLYRTYLQDHEPTLRIYAMADGDGALLERLCREGRITGPFLTARAVKLYADGALGSRGAALHQDYSDDPGNTGLLVTSPAELQRIADQAMGCGLQVAIHAIGDRGNTVALDIFERLASEHPANPGRHRIEHAQVIVPEEIGRFAKLGVIASVQPTHATSDMYWAQDRVGPERIRGAYAWQSLAETGARLALGSDFPVERADPLLGLYAAVARQDLEGWPAGGWRPEEMLTREQALAGFTRDAAYAGFSEDLVGTLAVGKRADFVVLSEDPVTVPVARIPALQVLATFVDGRQVYAAE